MVLQRRFRWFEGVPDAPRTRRSQVLWLTFIGPNQKALEASCHFSLECFLSKNRKGSSVSHTLTEAPYQCGPNSANRHNAQSSSCGVIVAARSGSSLCCRFRARTNGAAFEKRHVDCGIDLLQRFSPLSPRSHRHGPRLLMLFLVCNEACLSAVSSSHKHLLGFWLKKALLNKCYLTSAVKHRLRGMFLSMNSPSLSHTHTYALRTHTENRTDLEEKQLFPKRVKASWDTFFWFVCLVLF